MAETWLFTNIAYGLALILAWLVVPIGPALSLSNGRHECFWLVAVAVVCTYIYSVPPLRTKRLGIWANITIAIPRSMTKSRNCQSEYLASRPPLIVGHPRLP